jgi:hypothetical protein
MLLEQLTRVSDVVLGVGVIGVTTGYSIEGMGNIGISFLDGLKLAALK